MNDVDLNGDNGEKMERLLQLITALWNAADEHHENKSAQTAVALQSASEAVRTGIEQILALSKLPPSKLPPSKLPPSAGQMLSCDLDVARLESLRNRVDDEDATVAQSVRIPRFLDDYIRKFQARANDHLKYAGRRELTKQRIVAEALSLFMATHPLPDPAPDPT